MFHRQRQRQRQRQQYMQRQRQTKQQGRIENTNLKQGCTNECVRGDFKVWWLEKVVAVVLDHWHLDLEHEGWLPVDLPGVPRVRRMIEVQAPHQQIKHQLEVLACEL